MSHAATAQGKRHLERTKLSTMQSRRQAKQSHRKAPNTTAGRLAEGSLPSPGATNNSGSPMQNKRHASAARGGGDPTERSRIASTSRGGGIKR